MTTRGGCLCGEIKYEVTGSLGLTGHCHCSMCRRAHGAAFATYSQINPAEFRWLSGEELVSVFNSSPQGGRSFCSRCGSTLGVVESGRVTWITLGTVEGDAGVRPQAHIYAKSKAPWHEITDDLPQFDEMPPA